MTNAINKISKLLEETEEKWSNKVKEKFHPPEGTFSKPPKEIARIISQDKKASYQTAMARLNFFLNRGGENINPTMKAGVERAKEELRKMYKEK